MAKRPTIVDVARRAGVSIAVVSYALNGRPGVSASTRERVLRVAAECGWRPSVAARSLRSGPQRVGLVTAADGGSLGGEDRLLRFVAGLQSVLSPRRVTSLLHVADRSDDVVAVCADWWAERQVYAVVIPDVTGPDPRLQQLLALEVPVIGLDGPRGTGVPMVWSDDAAAFGQLAGHLLGLGHRQLARVVARPELAVSRIRDDAFTAAVRRGGGTVSTVTAVRASAAAVTEQLLHSTRRPTAIVYDDAAAAAAAPDVARRLGLDVPRDLSVVAGTDSARCRLATPALTALTRSEQDYGSAAGIQLLQILDGEILGHRQVAPAVLNVRASTGPVAS